MKSTVVCPPKLPVKYHILPESIDFVIPGFRRFYTPGDKTLALSQRDSRRWYSEFVERLIAAYGCQFLPVCRMSDGEFLFVSGEQPPDVRLPWLHRIRQKAGQVIKRLRYRGEFRAFTSGHYHSGRYSVAEWREARVKYAQLVRQINQKGILALHLSYGQTLFQEHYFPALRRWLADNHIFLTETSYVPFYFVYAAFTGPRRSELLRNRRVLVVNGARGSKRRQIELGLQREGVAEILWCQISQQRSLYDRLNLAPFLGKVDLAVIGAGIGKPNILCQMESLQVPCLDVGYVFEVWADPENRWKRPFCAPDDQC